jgi:hypothetical protein
MDPNQINKSQYNLIKIKLKFLYYDWEFRPFIETPLWGVSFCIYFPSGMGVCVYVVPNILP